MYHVIVIYSDQSFREFDHVNKIVFYTSSEYQTLEGDAIISYRYMLGNFVYHLFSEHGTATVSVHNAISFEVYKED
jgi:hypothetical protein